jgi:F420-dependent methylenetetrahydromethanopterin dehydrogenase
MFEMYARLGLKRPNKTPQVLVVVAPSPAAPSPKKNVFNIVKESNNKVLNKSNKVENKVTSNGIFKIIKS